VSLIVLKREAEIDVKKIGVFFGIAFFVVFAPTTCAQSTEESAQFLAEIEVSARFDRSWEDATKKLPALTAQLGGREEPDNPDLKAIREKLAALNERFIGRFAEEVRKPEVRAELVQVVKASYLKIYNAADIDALATFYRSPAGRSVASKLRDVSSESSSAVSDIMMRVTMPIIAEQRAASKAITDEFTQQVRARAAEAKKEREKARSQQ